MNMPFQLPFHSEAFIFGLTQSFIIGPMTIFAIREGLNPKKGIWYEIQVILAGITVDIIYLLVALNGIAQALTDGLVQAVMMTGAAGMLLMMGINTIREKHAKKLSVRRVHKHYFHLPESDFLRGFMLGMVNPLAVVFWVMVAGSMYSQYVAEATPSMFAMSIVVGGIPGSLIVIAATILFRKIINQKMLRNVVTLGSVILVGYGAFFAFKAFSQWQVIIASVLV